MVALARSKDQSPSSPQVHFLCEVTPTSRTRIEWVGETRKGQSLIREMGRHSTRVAKVQRLSDDGGITGVRRETTRRLMGPGLPKFRVRGCVWQDPPMSRVAEAREAAGVTAGFWRAFQEAAENRLLQRYDT